MTKTDASFMVSWTDQKIRESRLIQILQISEPHGLIINELQLELKIHTSSAHGVLITTSTVQSQWRLDNNISSVFERTLTVVSPKEGHIGRNVVEIDIFWQLLHSVAFSRQRPCPKIRH